MTRSGQASGLERIPAMDLRGLPGAAIRGDLGAAAAVVLTGIPTGVAYAMIADLPPVAGLYASMLPAIVGALFRSSRHVVVGPTNALSLLVGAAILAASGVEPMTAAITLALMVGVIQIAAGLLGLGALVDFISRPVVYGYITGAAALILLGQLPNLTGTSSIRGGVLLRLTSWVGDLGHLSPLTVAVAGGSLGCLIALRLLLPRVPGPMVVVGGATLLSWALDLRARGVKLVADISPLERGLPHLTAPDLSLVVQLFPLAMAITVLSLMESSAVGRSLASQTGQALDTAADFVGMGLANVAAAFSGGYPVSGSLARSALNLRAGARSRLSGVFGGLMMVGVVLVLAPAVNYTPVAALAALLAVVAWDLVDWGRIRFILRSGWPDRITFAVTLLGTWSLRLDQAIYLGVGLSLVFFLRQARMLVCRELVVERDGRLREADPDGEDDPDVRCEVIRLMQLEGRLFFGVEGELRAALDQITADPRVEVLIVRLRRTQGLDASIAAVFQEKAAQLDAKGRHLILVGLAPEAHSVLEATGVVAQLGPGRVYPVRPRWFSAMNSAVEHALRMVGPHHHAVCPLGRMVGVNRAASPLDLALKDER